MWQPAVPQGEVGACELSHNKRNRKTRISYHCASRALTGDLDLASIRELPNRIVPPLYSSPSRLLSKKAITRCSYWSG